MPLQIIRNDITKVQCDAIVNAANPTLLGGGGVDGAIHNAAGPMLLEECKRLGGCRVGEAKITNAYNLPAKYVIHTVGPYWNGGNHNEQFYLECCYRNSLAIAKYNNCETVAFPVISSGVYGYPMEQAFKVAVDTISSFLMNNDMTVYIVVYNNTAVTVSGKLFSDVKQYIDDNYVSEHISPRRNEMVYEQAQMMPMQTQAPVYQQSQMAPMVQPKKSKSLFSKKAKSESVSAFDINFTLDESFSEMLLRKIDEKGMTDAECYKKANIDRKLFSKIRSNPDYKPSKPTVIAFCIALELPLYEARDMLMKAGFALSHSNKFDVIIEYFIKNNNYNIFEINDTLFAFDQNLLGA